MGSATLEGRVAMGEMVIINLRTWMDGHKPPDRVLPRVGLKPPPRFAQCPLLTQGGHFQVADRLSARGWQVRGIVFLARIS
jgi:hypothetical protein